MDPSGGPYARRGVGDGREDSAPFPRPQRRQAIHLVSAWASANTLTLGQVKTEEKSNETAAMTRLPEGIAQGIADRREDCLLKVLPG